MPLDVHREQRDVRRVDARDAARLAQGARPQLQELLARLRGEPRQPGEVEVGRDQGPLLPAQPRDVLGLALDVARVLDVGLDRRGEVGVGRGARELARAAGRGRRPVRAALWPGPCLLASGFNATS